jgi:hypothetical protein
MNRTGIKNIKHKGLLVIFTVFAMVLIATVVILNNARTDYDHFPLDVVAIMIAYSGVLATSMFSFYIYHQGRVQSEISDTLKDLEKNRYISENYATFNFTREFSLFSDLDVDVRPILENKEYASSERTDGDEMITRLVMLINADGKPVSKIIFDALSLNKNNGEVIEFFPPEHEYDMKYTEKVKGRDYDLIQIDLMTFGRNVIDIIRSEEIDRMTVRVTTFSIFNVKMTADYYVKLMPENQDSFNENSPDKPEISDLYTRKLFYSRPRVVSKDIVKEDECFYSERISQ